MKKICLTGTPMPNGPIDIFGQYRFLDVGLFGQFITQFKNRYCELGYFNQVTAYRNEDDLNKRIYSIAIHIEDSVLDLPEKIFTERYCYLPPKIRKLYDEFEAEFYAEVDAGIVTASNVLTKIIRLRQMTGGFVKTEEGIEEQIDDTKIKLLLDELEDIDKDEPVIILALYTKELEMIKAAVEKVGRSCAMLSGSIDQATEWKAGEFNALIQQVETGGEGDTYSRSHYQYYYSLPRSLGSFKQVVARIRDTNQKSPNCMYCTLMVENSIDETLYYAKNKKKKIIDAILERR